MRVIPSAEAFLQSLEEGEASKNYEQSAKAEISQRESYLTGGLAMSEQQLAARLSWTCNE